MSEAPQLSVRASDARTVLIMGPTASGKSRLAMELARRFPIEIVSVDSAQVYIDMDIGTAKPSAADRQAVPHHLVDLLPPTEAYSAARFREEALAAASGITARNRLPLLVGGTMLYFKSLLEGLSPLPAANAALRAELEREAAALGWPALHRKLAEVDPETAARLPPRDSQRIQRALEIFRATGRPMSALLLEKPSDHRAPLLSIALMPADRPRLHERIASRFSDMLKKGLVEEVEGLRARYALSAELPSMRAVGYRQVWEYLDGALAKEELRDRGIFATRQLAKRQMTWLRSWPSALQLDCFDPALLNKTYDAICRALDRTA